MTRRAVIRLGSTISVFILFGLIGGIFLNTLLTHAASPSPAPASFSSAGPVATDEPTTDPAPSDPAPPAAPSATAQPPPVPPTSTPRPVPPTPTPAPTPDAQGKRIVVSLATQSLTAYENGKVVATTVVATGRPALPTLPGTFHIKAKYTPYQFISPWPKRSPYWYASAWVKYAMLYEDGGLHPRRALAHRVWSWGQPHERYPRLRQCAPQHHDLPLQVGLGWHDRHRPITGHWLGCNRGDGRCRAGLMSR